MRARRAAVVCAVLAGSLTANPGQAEAQGGWVCDAWDQTAKRSRTPEPDAAGRVYPVVTIHGITGSDEDFDGTIDKSYVGANPQPPRTLLDALAGLNPGPPPGLDGMHVFSFSYTENSLRWIDHAEVGGRFAKTIDCLYEKYGSPVSVVAHSMGGLVTRWVANTSDDQGRPRSEKLGKVVTLGSPYAGSQMSTIANGTTDVAGTASPLVALLNYLCGEAGTSSGEGSCGPIPLYSSFRSEAGRALRTASPEIAAAKPWPATVDVAALAGSQKVPFVLFGSPLNGTADLGDLAVTTASATANASSTRVFDCRYDSAVASRVTEWKELLGLADPIARRAKLGEAFLNSPCYHGNLMSYVEMTNEVLGQLNDWSRARREQARAEESNISEISPESLGPLRLGMSSVDASATGLIEGFREACDIFEPPLQLAELSEPLDGYAVAYDGIISGIAVGGSIETSPGGVSEGDSLDQFQTAMERSGFRVEIDYIYEELFAEWYVSASDSNGPVFATFASPTDLSIGRLYIGSGHVCE